MTMALAKTFMTICILLISHMDSRTFLYPLLVFLKDLLLHTALLCNPGWPGTTCVDQASLESEMLLTLPPERHAPPALARTFVVAMLWTVRD